MINPPLLLYFISHYCYNFNLSRHPDIDDYFAWNLLSYYADTRLEPINDFCEKKAAEADSCDIERFQKENILAGSLEQDSDYKKYEKIVRKSLEARTIVHPRQKKHDEALTKMRLISEKYQVELFGGVLTDETDDDMPLLDPPSIVLEKALEELIESNSQLPEFKKSHQTDRFEEE